jgi:hypothetical protein
MFFFKKSKINVDAFISEDYITVYNTLPIKYSHAYYPQWWKSLPAKKIIWDDLIASPNMKSCAGLLDYYKRGITIPMWSDLIVEIDNDNQFKWQFSDQQSTLVNHPYSQRVGFKDESIHLKLNSPWYIKSEKNVYFNFLPDYYNLNRNDFEIAPGTVEYYYQNTTNINILTEMSEKTIFISAGQPMINIVPLSERNIVLKNHVI